MCLSADQIAGWAKIIYRRLYNENEMNSLNSFCFANDVNSKNGDRHRYD